MTTDNKMVTQVFKKYLPVFNALGNPTRQRIMFLLADGSRRSVVELSSQIALSRPAVSHHLKILRDSKLVKAERDGARLFYSPIFQTPLTMSQDFVKVLNKI